MIREIKSKEFDDVYNAINKDFLNNPYFSLDIFQFGFKGDQINTYCLELNKKIILYMYCYYSSIQIFLIGRLNENAILEISRFIKKNKILRISGKNSILKRISRELTNYKYSEGKIMVYEKETCEIKNKTVKFATLNDLKAISSFILSCDEWNKSYNSEIFYKQLKNRLLVYRYKIAFIKEKGKIITTFAEYAKNHEFVILGGLLNKKDKKYKGNGKEIVKFLCTYEKNNHLTPLIYVFNKKLFKYYKKLGFSIVSNTSKLELIE